MEEEITFRQWLRQRRKEYGYTQEELAQLVGCSTVTLRRIEEGATRPSRQLAELIAEALEAPPEEREHLVRWARSDPLKATPASSATPAMYFPSATTTVATTAVATHAASSMDGGDSKGERRERSVANPYKGLRAFTETDAPDFFGREALVSRLAGRLSDGHPLSHFLAVVGPSGCGKSSVVRAGLLPALRHYGLPGGLRPVVVDITPGAHPFEEIEAALLRIAPNPPSSLMEQLRSDERGLVRVVKRALPDPHEQPQDAVGLLLVIDQFEEVFTLVQDEAARYLLLDSLRAAVMEPRLPLWVVITLRADFFDGPLMYGASYELVRERTEVMGAMAPNELHRAIVAPAGRLGVRFEPELVATLEQDMGERAGALPLLQFTLTDLFERREPGGDGDLITLEAYRATGGVKGALNRRAEEVHASLDPAEQAETHRLFLRLVTLGEGTEDTRRRVRRSELASAAVDEEALDRALEILGQARLLTFDRDLVTHGPTVEVAHEALLRTWGRLREWLDESREDLRVQRQLMAEVGEWEQSGKDPSYLATGARLAQFEALADGAEGGESKQEGGRVGLTAEEREYLRESVEESKRQEAAERERHAKELTLQKRLTGRLRVIVGSLAVFLALASVLALFALEQQNAAQANYTRAKAQSLAADAIAVERQVREGGASMPLAESAALATIHSLNLEYTPKGDEALLGALSLDYAVRLFSVVPEGVRVGTLTSAVPIRDVAFSPDGKRIVTASSDNTARLWDVQTGNELYRVTGTGVMHYPTFLLDGDRVCAATLDGTVLMWDAKSGTVLHRFTGTTAGTPGTRWPDVSTYGGSCSWDGKYAAVTGVDGKITIWDAQAGKQLHVLTGHTGEVHAVEADMSLDGKSIRRTLGFTPDGKYFLSVVHENPDKSIRVWDVETGQEIQRFNYAGDLWGVGALLSPDGRILAVSPADGGSQSVEVFDIRTGQQLHSLPAGSSSVFSLAFSRDGKRLAGSTVDSHMWVWDVQSGQLLTRFIGYPNSSRNLVFSPDGRYLLAGGGGMPTIRLYDVQTGKEIHTYTGHLGSVNAVAFSPDGKYLVSGCDDGTARLWEVEPHPYLPQFPVKDYPIFGLAYSPDGNTILTGDVGHNARLFDAHTGRLLLTLAGHNNNVMGVAYSPDGRYALTGSADRTAKLWDLQTGKELRTFEGHSQQLWTVQFSPDGKTMLTGSSDGTAKLWDVQTGKELRAFTGHSASVREAVLSPDGRYVAAASDDSSVIVWETETGKRIHTFTTPDWVQAVAFSPDGRYLAGGMTNTPHVRVWDVQSGSEVRQMTGHAATVVSVRFSPDGKYLLTGSVDATARVWDFQTGKELRRFTGHAGEVSAVFSPDGKYVLTGSVDGTVRMWEVDIRQGIKYLCGKMLRDFIPEERALLEITDRQPTCPGK